MSTHNICFCGEIREISIILAYKMHLRQHLFSLKTKNKDFRMSSATTFAWHFKR